MVRRKKEEPIRPPKKRKRDMDDPVVIGDSPACLPPPNHLVQFTPCDLFPYPLMHALVETDTGLEPAFVDGHYGVDYMVYREMPRLPPTWMDPQLFAGLAMQDERVKAIVVRAFKRNRLRGAIKALLPLMDEVMSDRYLAYLIRQFEARREILARWIVGRYADRHLLKKLKAEMQKIDRADRAAKSKKRKVRDE